MPKTLPRVQDHWQGANAELARVAARGDRPGVQAAVAAGGDPKAVSPQQLPMILWPVMAGSHEGYVALLDAGADPEQPYKTDSIATEFLVGLDDQRFLDTALSRGADSDAVASNREPLVWKAFYADRWDVVQKLVEAGADVDAANHDDPGHTLLSNASNGAFDRAVWLLERGADPSHRIETAPPGYEDRIGAQPILENIYYIEIDAERFPEGAAAQKRAQALVAERGHDRPPRPRRYAQ